MLFSFYCILEHVNDLCHASENENLLELHEVGLPIPNHPPPPPPVPVYSQINISIPCTSPQLDSMGSSPRSDYSSYSSSSSRNQMTNEVARDKILSEIRNLTPKLKKVSVSGTQSPRLNYMVNNVETTETTETNGKTTNSTKKVVTELLIPINNPPKSSSPTTFSLPDNLTFANQLSDRNHNETSKNSINNGITKDSAEYRNSDNLPDVPVCCVCNSEIVR